MRLEVSEISKNYGKNVILKEINLSLDNGIYAVLGPNGAGKSTLINIVTGVIPASKGKVYFNGKDIKTHEEEFLENLGYMPQNMEFYKNFTAIEMMRYIGVLKGLTQSESHIQGELLLKKVNLFQEMNKKIRFYSGGMKQRLGIAQALINNPSILIFDEPTAGLDPRERIRFRNVISKLARNKTVIICTHIVPDIDAIADKVILLRKGEIIGIDTPTALCDNLHGKLWDVNIEAQNLDFYLEKYKVYHVGRERDEFHLRLFSEDSPSIAANLAEVTLEDVYLYYFNEENENAFSI